VTEPIARLIAVSKTYGQGEATVHALREVDLDVHPGEVIVVLGPSGSGKTTLLNVMGAIEPATAGRVILGGEDLAGAGAEHLAQVRRDTVSFVFQFFNLIATLTAAENVRLIAELTSKAPRAEIDAAVAETLTAVGLAGRAEHFPGQLSGGEQQRAAIARALVTGPRLLLCDEPTGALDLETGRAVLGLLQDQATQAGRCVVIVTHNSGVAAMADRVIRVHDGQLAQIVEQHPHPAAEVTW
jgi:putative ABC transport system ATP-binding protein